MCLGIPGKIVSILEEGETTRRGQVDFGGISKEANLSLVADARVGDFVIVHAGFAISKVDEEEAGKIFEYLKEMDELSGLEGDGKE